jgi:Ethanolamine utilization protein EutJ (predicted chaperonin)
MMEEPVEVGVGLDQSDLVVMVHDADSTTVAMMMMKM